MLVYADRDEKVCAQAFAANLRKSAGFVRAAEPGLERHSWLVALLIDAGRLLQGVADAGLPTGEMTDYLMGIGRAVVRSVDTRFGDVEDVHDPPDLIGVAGSLSLRHPEGFAFYAVYPEAYVVAARKLRLSAPPCVIGIRSIGTSLAAVTAAALGARTFTTVRPTGDPFDRRLSIAPAVEKELPGEGHHYVIVDEGPGLSGSSFGAVADWLQGRGVPLKRIAFIPSHENDPGPQASEAHRALWKQVQRSPAVFDSAWLSDLLGPLEQQDVGSGLTFSGMRDGERVLIRFAGLGSADEHKFAMAQALYVEGWTPKPLMLAHGFLVERWQSDATPDRDPPVSEMAEYIGSRARLFPARAEDGASLQLLFEMVRRNVLLALGEPAAASLKYWSERLASLARTVVRARTDNQMDASKWLRLPCGQLIKTDAVDHWCSHDLIGAQDPAWDVAGAAIEFALERHEIASLAAQAGRAAGRLIDPELIEFSMLAYCAFRLGQAQLTGRTERTARYEERLRQLLPQQSNSGIWRETALAR